MRPTEILSREHRAIERALDCLECLAIRASAQGIVASEPTELVLGFLEVYLEELHHDRKEARLFDRLRDRGLPSHLGPIAALLEERDVGREHVRHMREAMQRAARGDAAGRERFAYEARRYVDLLREHMAREDALVFPRIEQYLGADDRAELAAEFERADAELGPGACAALLASVGELARALGVENADAKRPPRAVHFGRTSDSSCGYF